MTKDKRSKIPQAIKREVRQRCCFGCVHCGNPIIEYHHIIPWNQVQTHEEDNLTILCSNCHKKVTNGLISCAQVIEWNNNPYNRNKIYSPTEMLGYRIFDRQDINKLQIDIANSQFKIRPINVNLSHYIMIPIMIDGTPLIAFTIINGRLSLYLELFDEENNVAVKIVNNEVITRLDFWDITFIGNTLKVNRKNRDIFIEIDFNVPYSIHVKKGYLMYNKKGFKVYSEYIKTLETNNIFSNITITNTLIGISMGKTPSNMRVGISIS